MRLSNSVKQSNCPSYVITNLTQWKLQEHPSGQNYCYALRENKISLHSSIRHESKSPNSLEYFLSLTLYSSFFLMFSLFSLRLGFQKFLNFPYFILCYEN